MAKKDNKAMLKIATVGITCLLVGGLGAGFIADDSNKVDKLTAELDDLKNQPVPEAEIVEVEVDNGNLDLVLERMLSDEGNVSYITNGLDDDEANQIADRIVFINEAKSLAVDAVSKLDIADELDDYDSLLRLEEDDIEKIKVQDKDEDVTIEVSDFNDSDANVTVKVEFEQDNVDYEAVFDVKIKDGEVDGIKVSSITEQQ